MADAKVNITLTVDDSQASRKLDTVEQRIEMLGRAEQNLQRLNPVAGVKGIEESGLTPDQGVLLNAARSEARRGVAGPGTQALQEEYDAVLNRARQQAFDTRPSRKAQSRQTLAELGDTDAIAATEQEAQQIQRRTLETTQAARLREFGLQSRVGVLMSAQRNPVEDQALRTRVAKVYGLEDEEAITERIGALQAGAVGAGLITTPGQRFLNRVGSMAGRISLFGAAMSLQQTAVAYASARGAGEPFRLQENLQGPLSASGAVGGALVGSAFGPAGTAIGAAAGGFILGGIGSGLDAYNRANRQLTMSIAGVANQAGMQTGALRAYINSFERIPGETGGNYFGGMSQEQILQTVSGAQSFRLGGANQAASLYLARAIAEDKGEIAPDVVNSLAPFAANPFISPRLYNSALGIRGDRNNRLDSGDPAEMVLTGGLPATVEALRRLGLNNRADEAIRFNNDFLSSQYGARNATTDVSIYGSRSATLAATGIAPDNPRMIQAQQAVIGSLERQRQAIETEIGVLQRSGRPHEETAAKMRELGAAAESLGSQIAQATQNLHVQPALFAMARLGTASSVAGSAVQGEAYGLAPGSIAPSRNALEAVHRAQLTNAQQRANDMSLPAEMRLQAQAEAAQLQNQVRFTDPLARIQERYGSVAAHGLAFTNIQQAFIRQRIGFGADEETAAGLLGSGLPAQQRTLQEQQNLLAALQRQGIRNPEILDPVRASIAQSQIAINEAVYNQAILPSQRALRQSGYALSETQASTALGLSLGLGPQSDLALNRRLVTGMLSQRSTLLNAAQDRFNAGDEVGAEGLRNQANLLQTQIASTQFQALASFRPSNRDTAAIGQLELGISLAQGNPFTGGQVPRGLRTALIQRYGQQLGQLDAQAAQRPAGAVRDAFLANTMSLRSSLEQGMQTQQVAAMFGDRSHMEDWASNMPGNILIRSFTSLAAYQGFGGTNPALGGHEQPEPSFRNRRVTVPREDGTPIPQSARRGFIPHGGGTASHLPATLGTTNVSHPADGAAFLPVMTESRAMGEAGQSDALIAAMDRLTNALLGKGGKIGGGPSSGLGAGQQFLNDPAEGIKKASGL
jgi:hypothetical protein